MIFTIASTKKNEKIKAALKEVLFITNNNHVHFESVKTNLTDNCDEILNLCDVDDFDLLKSISYARMCSMIDTMNKIENIFTGIHNISKKGLK